MPLIHWYDSFNVHVREIDQQHQQLVAMINTLHDAMRERKTRKILGDIIDGMIEYASVHFTTEEKYFDRLDYPDKEAHKAEHRIFVDKVREVKKGFDEDRVMISVEIMDFLKNWLVKHIQGSDKKFGPYFNRHGLY